MSLNPYWILDYPKKEKTLEIYKQRVNEASQDQVVDWVKKGMTLDYIEDPTYRTLIKILAGV